MNLIEALKSGKRFKRKDWTAWNDSDCVFHGEEVLAEDWELEPSSVTITRNDFFKAYAEVIKKRGYSVRTASGFGSPTETMLEDSIGDLAKELGL